MRLVLKKDSFLTCAFYFDLGNPSDISKYLKALNLAQKWQNNLSSLS